MINVKGVTPKFFVLNGAQIDTTTIIYFDVELHKFLASEDAPNICVGGLKTGIFFHRTVSP